MMSRSSLPSLALRLPVLVPASQGNFHLSEVTHQPVRITSDWWKILVSPSIFSKKSKFYTLGGKKICYFT
jgi:hypothetical protein